VCAATVRLEPLPLIADHLLRRFDDARAVAVITLLTAPGCITQVILFTTMTTSRQARSQVAADMQVISPSVPPSLALAVAGSGANLS